MVLLVTGSLILGSLDLDLYLRRRCFNGYLPDGTVAPNSVTRELYVTKFVPRMAQRVIDRCMQIHGAGGLTADYPMAEAFNYARWCRQADGPDQVHMMALGKQLVRRYS